MIGWVCKRGDTFSLPVLIGRSAYFLTIPFQPYQLNEMVRSFGFGFVRLGFHSGYVCSIRALREKHCLPRQNAKPQTISAGGNARIDWMLLNPTFRELSRKEPVRKNTNLLVSIERRAHPVPFRTRQLSSSSPMILHIYVWESRPMPALFLPLKASHASRCGAFAFFAVIAVRRTTMTAKTYSKKRPGGDSRPRSGARQAQPAAAI
ncbi:MAG: hypothetical protein DELT_00668 [Desulfovibrio sp.]